MTSTLLSSNTIESRDCPADAPGRSARWLVLTAGTLLQLCLGTVYAWSYFQKLLLEAYGWNNKQAGLAFSLAICFLGLTAAVGGVQLPRFGPRKLATTGGLLFGLGYLVAAAALHWQSLPLFCLGYGVIGGCGLGLGYVTPVATVAKWFPRNKGLATGVVIMGFGLGAMLMSTVLAPWLKHACHDNLVEVFAWLGATLGALSMVAGLLLHNPPAADRSAARPAGDRPGPVDTSLGELIFSKRFALMWGMFFANIVAGISIISFQSPLIQDLYKAIDPSLSADTLAMYGAVLIAVSSLFNGVGRMFWGGLSDGIGRLAVFRAMLATQIVAFALLATIARPWLFGAVVCYVLLCYGGGFGTVPAMVLDAFGPRAMAAVYGAMLTAWSAGGVIGPLAMAALKDNCGPRASVYGFACSAAMAAVGLMLSLALGRHLRPAASIDRNRITG